MSFALIALLLTLNCEYRNIGGMDTVAERIITKLGGAHKVAEITGLEDSSVYRWTYPKSIGGTGGIIPTRHQSTLLRAAIEMGIDLNPLEFFDVTIPRKIKRNSKQSRQSVNTY